MRVLFLDFDGVLNSASTWRSRPDGWEGQWEGNRDIPLSLLSIRLEPEKVGILNGVLNTTGSVVVLSTSWRNWPEQDYVRARLDAAGFEGTIVGATPGWLGPGKRRGDEIQAWLDENQGEVEAFAILDDSDDMGSLMPYLVCVDPMTGLNESYVPKLVELLTPAGKTTEWTRCERCGCPVLIGTFCGRCLET
jgi:hypothetical protein